MYNQVDKHLKYYVLQCIINIELKGNHLLCYDEPFKEEKYAFDRTKVFFPFFSKILRFLFFLFLFFDFFNKKIWL